MLGQWIQHRRRHLALTQKALANRARCSEAWVKQIEQDRHPPGEELANALAEALEIPPHYRATFIRAARTGNFAGQPAPETLESLPPPPTIPPLPSQPTRFFGRARELEDIARALSDPNSRLLTLLGPGGIGKTRVALYAAEQHHAAFDAVYFASLREIEAADQIAQAIADALQLPRLPNSDPTLQVAAYLSQVHPKTLLVLDNFEHLMDGAGIVDALLEHARELKIIVTSRERLRSLWEQSLELSGLEYPTTEDADHWEEFTSVQLFIERARRAFPRFPFKSEARDVARICQLVEGHPLAIELAAAWVATFACGEIAEHIEKNITLLKKQRQDISDAHRSVAATFDYSYTLLSSPEQRIFRTLGIFEGGFDPEAAAKVAGAERRTLAEFVDKSLVQREGRRFNLHELLRRYAAEKLVADEAEAHAAGALLFRYYLDYARTSLQDYARLEPEWSNFNAGLRLAHQQREWQTVADYATTLQQAWETRGRFSDARQAYHLACEAAQARGDEKAYAHALREWGHACIEQGDYSEAEKYLNQSLEVCERLDDPAGMASAEFYLARIAIEQSRFRDASRRLSNSLFLYRQIGDQGGIAASLYNQASVEYYDDKYRKAEEFAKQALEIQQALGHKRNTIPTLRLLAHISLHTSDSLDPADDYCNHALTLAEELGDRGEAASALGTLAEIHRRRGDIQTAQDLATKSLTLFKEIGDRKSQAQVLYRLILIYGKQNPQLALQFGKRSLALCQELEDKWGMVFVLDDLATIYRDVGDAKRAKELFRQGESIATGLQNVHPRLEAIRTSLQRL